jgi:hypothetical protein
LVVDGNFEEALMSAAQVKSLDASMPENLAKARRKFGRPLTLSPSPR